VEEPDGAAVRFFHDSPAKVPLAARTNPGGSLIVSAWFDSVIINETFTLPTGIVVAPGTTHLCAGL
jgi:hypothetical protein